MVLAPVLVRCTVAKALPWVNVSVTCGKIIVALILLTRDDLHLRGQIPGTGADHAVDVPVPALVIRGAAVSARLPRVASLVQLEHVHGLSVGGAGQERSARGERE